MDTFSQNRVGQTLVVILLVVFQFPAMGQSQFSLEVLPDPIRLGVGESKRLQSFAIKDDGTRLEMGFTYFMNLRYEGAVPSSGIEVNADSSRITGRVPGEYTIFAVWSDTMGNFAKRYVPAIVSHGNPAEIAIDNLPDRIFSGSVIPLELKIQDHHGFPMDVQQASLSVDDDEIAALDPLNNLYAKSPGKTRLSIKVYDIETSIDINILPNPVSTIDLEVEKVVARTGDVLAFHAMARDSEDNEIKDASIVYTVSSKESELASGASAIIEQDGRFVAEKAGIYTIMASIGDKSAVRTVKIEAREVSREIEVVGHGKVNDKHTSDFWVWEGIDGRDYAVTGTWGADGKAYFWDVTDPSDLQRIDSFQVDARTVNDVKVSEDGKICVISREGASNRKNGIVILDVTDPRNVRELSTFTETLTGGVHNLFIYDNHVYALSNGQRYDVINIEDPQNPHRVGKFEIENPARSIHDVWIEDGLAYSSNWNDGIIIVDVGNGIAGGSPSNPVEIARSRVEGDANHAAFPFRSSSTGKFYVIAGDEIFPTSFIDSPNADMEVFTPSGYLHFMDFSDPNNPKEVARYEVPEAGSHNFWVEDDILYIGYYNGGVRVVDLSGDLLGDLYKQGREMAHFVPAAADAYVPNFAMVWGAQPHKGHVFFSDFNSGLWSVKVRPKEELKN